MKCVSVLTFAAVAAAFVVPDANVFTALANEAQDPFAPHLDEASGPDAFSIREHYDDAFDDEDDLFAAVDDRPHPGPPHRPHRPHRPHHPPHHHKPNLTIYELISKSKYTTEFAKIVDKYDSIVKILNSTKANYTLFVPTDAAFRHLPNDTEHKPDKEFIEAALSYHIGLGLYPAGRILATHTLPTAYNESFLGGEPQRLRTSFGLGGVRVNFYSRVVAANIPATNGIIHGVNRLLVPPPMVGRELTLFPTIFSTLLLAYEKTDFVKFIHDVKMNGSTVFAPDNAAFKALGPRANAFLFNTETGLKYLRALLKYHIVANATLYSDALYQNTATGTVVEQQGHNGHTHVDLPTLLDDKPVAVDIARWGGFIRMRVNGYVRVVVQDGIAKNGVIQTVGRVLIPPHHHKRSVQSELDGEISVEELMERLAPFVDEDKVKKVPAWNSMSDL